jgi:hypothetical protein
MMRYAMVRIQRRLPRSDKWSSFSLTTAEAVDSKMPHPLDRRLPADFQIGANPENEEVSSALIRLMDTVVHGPIERSPAKV